MKRIFVTLIALIIAALMCGCTRNTIKIAAVPAPYMKKAVEYYEKETGKKAELVEYNDDTLKDKTVDVVLHPLDYEMINSNNLYDFTGSSWVSDVNIYCIDSIEYDGCVMGLPFSAPYCSGCFYNKTIFDVYNLRIPTNQQEFDDTCDALEAIGITPIFLGSRDIWPVAYQLGLEGLYNSDISRIPVWWKKGADRGWFGKDWYNATFSMADEEIGEGRAAMIFCSDNWMNYGFRQEYKYKSSDFGMMPMFMGANESGMLSGSQVDILSVKKDCDDFGDALEFVELMSESKCYNYVFEGERSIPIFKLQTTIIQTPQFMESGSAFKRMPAVYPRIKGFNQSEGAKAIIDYMHGDATLEACLDTIDKE